MNLSVFSHNCVGFVGFLKYLLLNGAYDYSLNSYYWFVSCYIQYKNNFLLCYF